MDEHLDYFQFFTILNKAAMNMLVYVLGIHTGVELLGLWV